MARPRRRSRSCCRPASSPAWSCRAAVGPQLASYEQAEQLDERALTSLVRFKPQASAADITKFLADNKATVVGGPAAGTGLFRLRVADKALAQAELVAPS